MFNLRKIASATYLLPKEGGMRVPGLIIADEEFLQEEEMEQPLTQVRNVAYLPGIVGYSIAMPDIHWGYGFPIGGVAGTDAKTGVISPGGVGYDINCGVRLAIVPEPFSQLTSKVKHDLLSRIFQKVPSGVGKGRRGGEGLKEYDYQQVAKKGALWSIEQGYGFAKDLDHTESRGFIPGADIAAVSEAAKHRGMMQLGSVGSGNHFIEIGEVQEIFLPKIAAAWEVEVGQTYILIHCGSRGFGHQVCQDTLNHFIQSGYAEALPDRQLVAAPIQSEDGQRYFAAMAAAANYAFNNRQRILHEVRAAFMEVCQITPEKIHLIYDVAHNIAKFEEHEVDGVVRKLCIHRKGATRALGPGHPELPENLQQTGQPVLVPGDMGRASFLMVGKGNPLTFCSACHGAGRRLSRHKSKAAWRHQDPLKYMREQKVEVMASSYNTIVEEMPDAYKDVERVVKATREANLADPVARLHPALVVKG